MKIGILTQPLQANYGGLLQNYALQQTLIRAGHEVETIDWGRPKSLRAELYRMKLQFLATWFQSQYPEVRYQPSKKELATIWRNTNHFINAYLNHTVPMHSLNEFRHQANIGKYDAFVVGSDQCWRPCYNLFLSSMFLEFANDMDVKRISYAASFGTDKWEFSPQQTAVCASLAQKFDLVTVREDSGVTLCKDYLGVDAVHVLDPTMLLSKEDYIQIIEKEQEPKSDGTLFNYILDPDEKKSTFIDKVAHENGLKVFQVLPKCQAETRTRKDVKTIIDDCVFPGVSTWLRAFMDAEMTVVDSFHGMVFSILFNKPFWVIGNAHRGMSRFTSLLKVFHLENRLLDASGPDDVDLSQSIDWESVNEILKEKQKECKLLLLNSLDE